MSNTPENLKYSKSHEWLRMEGGEAVVGITHFAQEALGDITYVDLPAVGDTLAQDKEFGAVESVKAASDLFSPVNGKVLAVNDALDASPEIVNRDPYGEGWLMRVSVAEAPQGLMDAAQYVEHCKSESH